MNISVPGSLQTPRSRFIGNGTTLAPPGTGMVRREMMTDGTLPGDAGSNASIGCRVGSREDDTRHWHGQLVSFMVCQGLTDGEELAVEAALIAIRDGTSNGVTAAAATMGTMKTGWVAKVPLGEVAAEWL